jgi:hypothetical protein
MFIFHIKFYLSFLDTIHAAISAFHNGHASTTVRTRINNSPTTTTPSPSQMEVSVIFQLSNVVYSF